MQVLTPSGYVDILDLNIGDEVIAYDINTGAQIINHLEGKTLWTPDMYPAEYTVGHYDENGDWVPPVLVNTSYEVFQRIQGDWVFYRINGTFDFYKSQSIWTNMNVVHASDLQVGDIIYNDLDEDIVITSIEQVEHSIWWKLEVSGDSSYIADGITFHNASRYWVGGGSSTNWNATGNTNWSASSGGANNASVPTSADGVFFNDLGNSNSVISAGITVLSLSISSGHTATMTHNALLQIAGSVTFGANYTIAGTSNLQLNATGTITSNGKTWPNGFVLSVAPGTFTLVGDFTINGILYVGAYNQAPAAVVNKTTTEKLIVNGGLAGGLGTGPNNINGTAQLDFYGSTWTAVQVGLPMTVYGTVALSGSNLGANGAFTNLGTINAGTSTFNLGPSPSFNSNGAIWNNVTIGFSNATLSSDLIVNGTYAAFGGSNVYKTTNESIYVYGGFTTYYQNSTFGGTATVILKGGTWTTTQTNTPFAMPITIDGNITISGVNVLKSGSTDLRYISGVITTTGSTLRLGSCSLFLSGMTLNNVGLEGTVTLGENLFVSGITTVTSPSTLNKTASEKLVASGGLTISSTLAGTATVELTGGTWSGANTTGISNNLNINGNVTISGNVYYRTGILSYISGTPTVTGSTLNLTTSCTLNTNGMSWNNITSAGNTFNYILTSDLYVNGLINFPLTGSGATISKTTNENIYAYGGCTISSQALTTSASIYLRGGTVSTSGNGFITGTVYLDGNVTIGTIFNVPSQLTYLSGIITTTGSTIVFFSATIKAGAVTWNNVSMGGGGNYTATLQEDLIVNGLLTGGSGNQTQAINKTTTQSIYAYGGVSVSGTNTSFGGTATLVLKGGTWSHTATTGVLIMPTTIDGNITISGGVYQGTGTLTYTSGIITPITSGTLNLTNSTQTLAFNAGSNMLAPITIAGGTKTLSTNFSTGGLVTISGATIINKTVSEVFTYGGGLTMSSTLGGTATVNLTGGTWSGASTLSSPLNINGNITVSGNVYYGTGTITYVSGTPVVTGSKLNLVANCTLNTSTMAWNDISFNAVSTIVTLTSNLITNGALITNGGGSNRLNKTTNETVTTFGGISLNAGSLAGTALLYFNGGTWSGTWTLGISITINGNVTLTSGEITYEGNTFTYLSGDVTAIGNTIKIGNGATIFNTNGMLFNNFQFLGNSGTITLTSDLYINGALQLYQTLPFNKTNNEKVVINNGIFYNGGYSVIGTASVYLQGGTITASGTPRIGSSNFYFNGNITLNGTVYCSGGILTYLSGNLNTNNGIIAFEGYYGASTVIDFHKCPIQKVIVTTGQTVTMNQFFTGTPQKPVSITASTAAGQYTIAFTDSFERISENVVLSGCILSSPQQLIVSYPQRINTLKTTNRGVRFINQSPNGFAKNAPTVSGFSTGPAQSLASDPCFTKQS